MISVKLYEHLPGVEDFGDQLREIGLHATIPSVESDASDKQTHEAIWIGCSLPPDLVIAVVKAAFKQWPSLKYLHLSSDQHQFVPESVHYQIYIGGPSEAALGYGCQPWTPEVIADLDNNMSLTALHILIRTGYRQEEPATHVRYVGGPLDGEEHFYAGPPKELASRVRTFVNALYELRYVDEQYEYHYAGKKAPAALE